MVLQDVIRAQLYSCHVLQRAGITVCWVVWEGFLEEVHKGPADPRRREGTAGRRSSVSKGRRRKST